MPRKDVPDPAIVTVAFEGPGPEAYAAIADEHGARLAALAGRSADTAEAARLRALAEQLSRLRTESAAAWLPLIRYAAESYQDLGTDVRDAVTAMVDAYLAVRSGQDRAEADSIHVNRALRILAVRRPDAYAALAAVLSGPAIDPTAEEC